MSFQFYSMTFLTSLLHIFTSSCQTKELLHLDYASGVCAHKLYPVEVYRGDFYTDNDWLPIPNGGRVEDGWGDNGMNMSRNGIIPTSFKITYFSYVENKFYTGDFKLPYDLIENAI